MKKFIIFAIALVLSLTLSACGEKEAEERDYSDHTLTVYFVPSRPAEEILEMTAPLEAMLLQKLKDAGAKRVYAFATHGLFSGPAYERIKNRNHCIGFTFSFKKIAPKDLGEEDITDVSTW